MIMLLFTTKWLSTIFTNYKGDADSHTEIETVVTDSRLKVKQSLFIPLIGDQFDGHQFVEHALSNGAVAILWQEDKELPGNIPEHVPTFFVKDTLKALQHLAALYRNKIDPIVVGITGSNGKTTTKDIVSSVVKTTYRTHFTQGNLNNHIGLPLTILGMPNDTEVLVLEMGMNHFNEIDLLSNIAKPDYAIITNIGESHIEYLGSREGITKAKLEIVNGLSDTGTLIIDGDETLLKSQNTFPRMMKCGFSLDNDVVISKITILVDRTTFTLEDGDTYHIPLLGQHHAKNAAYAIALGRLLRIEEDHIKQGLSSLELTGMRFELLEGKNKSVIINDAYNASPTSMKATIEVVKQMEGFQEKVLILGDIFELGVYSEELHRSVAQVIDASSITAVLTYGNDAKYISSAVKEIFPDMKSIHYDSKDTLLNDVEQYLKPNSLILFKASRGMEFEKLVESVLI